MKLRVYEISFDEKSRKNNPDKILFYQDLMLYIKNDFLNPWPNI